MIGAKDLDIIGYDFNNKPHQIFKNGNWAIALTIILPFWYVLHTFSNFKKLILPPLFYLYFITK